MNKNHQRVKELDHGVLLMRDRRSGLAWAEDANAGTTHTVHASVAAEVSAASLIAAMRDAGKWGAYDRIVRVRGFHYNIDVFAYDPADAFAGEVREHCRCGGNHGVRYYVVGKGRLNGPYDEAEVKALAESGVAAVALGAVVKLDDTNRRDGEELTRVSLVRPDGTR